MEDTDPFRKYVDVGLALTQLTRARAEALVKELVKAGDLQREHAQERVEELLDRSRRTTDGLAGVIRKEMAQQLSSMGFATKEDLDKLEARMERRFAAMGAGGARTKAPPTRAAGTAKAAPGAKVSKAAPGKRPAKAAKAKATAPAPAVKAPQDKAAKAAPVSKSSKAATAPPGTAARKAAANSPGRRGRATGASPAPS